MYTPNEISQIQEAVNEMNDGPGRMTPARIGEIRRVLISGVGEHFQFAAPLAVDHPDLYRRVLDDPQVAKYSYLGLMPATVQLAYDNADDAVITPMVGTRERIFLFSHLKGDYIIKPYQSDDERKIAPLAGELGFGPRQFPSIRTLITEEFLYEEDLLTVNPSRLREVSVRLGQRLGDFYRELHRRKIFYNDALVDSESDKSHVLIGREPEQAKVIDYGVSLDVTDPSTFTDNQVASAIRTKPGVSLFLSMGAVQIEMLVERTRDRIRSMTTQELLKRDLEMLEQSVADLQHLYGVQIANFIREGFEQTYYL